jgi:hypothetical protein
MGITAIKKIVNQSTDVVTVDDHENPDVSVSANPRTTTDCNMWIPWCTSPGDFDGNHYIKVSGTDPSTAVTPKWIWQHYVWRDGDFVRYSTDGCYHAPGDRMPGDPSVNGDRTLTIDADGGISLSKM